MTDIDEAMLIAWVDGELDDVTRRRVDRAVAEDPALAERLALHRRLRERISDHYAPVEADPVPAAMTSLLEGGVKVVPFMRPAASRRRNWGMVGAVAASLVLGVGIGHLSRTPSGPVAVQAGALVAQGPLASALDSQLASTQQGTAIRIGLSFQRKGGGWCRSFDGDAIAGVACREERGWQVQQLVPGSGQGSGYRQASSAYARVMATIDSLMIGAPADAAKEAEAKASGWR